MRTHRLPHASSHEDTSWATTFGQPQVVAQPPQQPESHSLRAHRGSFTPRVVRGKHVSLELSALLGIFALHENFLGGLPSGRETADGTLFLFPLQSAIPSHIHDRNGHITSPSCVSGPRWGMGEGRITTRIFLANARGHPARFAP